MPKFLYCMDCNCVFELDETLKTCKICKNGCENIGGKYRPDGDIADVCAKNSKKAYFIGISCNRRQIMKEILQHDQDIIDKIFTAINCLSGQQEVPINKHRFKKNPNLMIGIAPLLGFLCNPDICSENLSSTIKITEEWKQFDKHKKEFQAIQSYATWKDWEKDHIAHDQHEWNCLLDKKGYAIGIVESIEKEGWHEKWKYCKSLCEEMESD